MTSIAEERQGTCPICSQTFDRFPNGRGSKPKKYCSMACYNANRAALITANCPTCGKEYTYTKSWPLQHCSKECFQASRRVTTTCPICAKEFWYHKSWPRKYCSNVCAGKANVKNIKHFGESRYVATCEHCGIEFETSPARNRGRFCSLACFGAWQVATGWQSGEKHPNWTGGYEPYYGPSWRAARRAVRQRDTACQDCGITREELGRELDVHHITPFRKFGRARHEEANALSNLVALCNRCHTTREYAERS